MQLKKIDKIVYRYINIESTMNGFIKFEIKKLKTKKIVNVHFRNCCANNCQILIEEFIYIRR